MGRQGHFKTLRLDSRMVWSFTKAALVDKKYRAPLLMHSSFSGQRTNFHRQ